MDDRGAGREAAIVCLRRKRNFFRSHVVTYLVVNTMFVAVWAVSGAGYFWPIWPILGWGIGLAINAWIVHGQRRITEADTRRETQRNMPQGSGFE